MNLFLFFLLFLVFLNDTKFNQTFYYNLTSSTEFPLNMWMWGLYAWMIYSMILIEL